jgi:hypothetical protein
MAAYVEKCYYYIAKHNMLLIMLLRTNSLCLNLYNLQANVIFHTLRDIYAIFANQMRCKKKRTYLLNNVASSKEFTCFNALPFPLLRACLLLARSIRLAYFIKKERKNVPDITTCLLPRCNFFKNLRNAQFLFIVFSIDCPEKNQLCLLRRTIVALLFRLRNVVKSHLLSLYILFFILRNIL